MSQPTKLQRLTSMAVPALLAANAMVLVLGLASIADDTPAGAETVTYITGADGSLIAVDPNTPEGWKAIAEAEQRGEKVVTVDEQDAPATLLQQRATTTTTPVGGKVVGTDGKLLDPVNGLLDDTESTVVDTIGKVGDAVDGVVDKVTDIVDDTTGTKVGDIVDPAVDDTTDTLTTTVSTVVADTRTTATTVLAPVTDVVETVPSGSSSNTNLPTAPAPALPNVGL